MEITEHPKYITTAGFGCIYSNYGLGPATPEEPTIVTKFFGSDRTVNESFAYSEEKKSHADVITRCGNFSTMNSIFGVDLNSGQVTLVKGYDDMILVKGRGGTVKIIQKQYPYSDVSPRQVCEMPNYKGAKLDNPVYKINGMYPVIKMNYLGIELFDKQSINLNTFIQSLELLALFHTGMIHNDIKGNNMLISPLTRRVSLIDFGLCKPYTAISNTPPYKERSGPVLEQSWYAYPPEYSFLSPIGNEYFPHRKILTDFYLDHYDELHGSVKWPNHLALNKIPGETDSAREERLSRILEKIYVEYFKSYGPDDQKMPKIFLETAITGDTYALGIEKEFIYRNSITIPVDIGTSTITGNEFLNRISVLVTALHPKYRPYHINILKLFKHYNRRLVHGAVTFIKVEGDETPYTELSILNGNPSIIQVKPGMALGKPGCPITSNDVKENLMILYFLLQKDTLEIHRYINDLNKTYLSVLQEAGAFIKQIPSTLFPLDIPAPIAKSRPFVQVRPLVQSVSSNASISKSTKEIPNNSSQLSKPDYGIYNGSFANAKIPLQLRIYHSAPKEINVNLFLPPNFNGGKRKTRNIRHVGGNIETRLIYTTNIVNDLIYSGILSIGVYIAAIEKSSKEVIEETLIKEISKKIGGRATVLQTVQNLFKPVNNVKKLNRGNTRNAAKRQMTLKLYRYSNIQKKAFFNEITTSTHVGKINILHAYYLKYLPHDNQKEIINLLLFTPMADSKIVQKILDYLSEGSITQLITYLTALNNTHIVVIQKYMPLDVNKAKMDLSKIIDEYIHSNNYELLFNTLDKFTV